MTEQKKEKMGEKKIHTQIEKLDTYSLIDPTMLIFCKHDI